MTFYPQKAFISNISNEQYGVITFTEDHDFLVNEIIGLRVSKPYGMVEINNKQVKIIDTTADTVTIDLDTTNYSPFTIPGDTYGTTPPCAVPSSSGVDLQSAIPRTILEDAFDNRP